MWISSRSRSLFPECCTLLMESHFGVIITRSMFQNTNLIHFCSFDQVFDRTDMAVDFREF